MSKLHDIKGAESSGVGAAYVICYWLAHLIVAVIVLAVGFVAAKTAHLF